jgi:hypothetical protein
MLLQFILKCVKIILISVKEKAKIAKIILFRQRISTKRWYFQFKKDRPDLGDPATMYLFRKYNLKLKTT